MAVAISSLAVLGFLVFGLGFWISMLRFTKKNFYFGTQPDPTSFMTKLVRAHGNTCEYVGILAVLILFTGTLNPPQWVLGAMILATAGRVVAVIGFLTGKTLDKINPVKATGAMATYFGGLALCAALIILLTRMP